MCMSFKLRPFLVNTAVFIYFSALIIVNQFEGPAVSAIWYLSLLVCALIGVYSFLQNFDIKIVLFLAVMLLTGLLNCILIKTSSIREQLLLLLLLFVSFCLMDKDISERVLLTAVLAVAAVIVWKYLTVGFWGQIFTNSSSNFVSVFLLYPAVLYYTINWKKNKKIVLYPAVLIWTFSLLARGRGGIISTTFFLVGLLLAAYDKTKGKRRLIIIMLGILACAVLALNLDRILDWINSSVILEYFKNRGLKSSSRITIWKNYFSVTLSSLKQVFLGTDISKTYAGNEFGGNPHNTLINIHMHNGLIMLLIIVFALTNKIIGGIEKRQYVYVVCLLTMLIRMLTDNVFWPTYGTPVLFFFLFFAPDDSLKSRLHLTL